MQLRLWPNLLTRLLKSRGDKLYSPLKQKGGPLVELMPDGSHFNKEKQGHLWQVTSVKGKWVSEIKKSANGLEYLCG